MPYYKSHGTCQDMVEREKERTFQKVRFCEERFSPNQWMESLQQARKGNERQRLDYRLISNATMIATETIGTQCEEKNQGDCLAMLQSK